MPAAEYQDQGGRAADTTPVNPLGHRTVGET